MKLYPVQPALEGLACQGAAVPARGTALRVDGGLDRFGGHGIELGKEHVRYLQFYIIFCYLSQFYRISILVFMGCVKYVLILKGIEIQQSLSRNREAPISGGEFPMLSLKTGAANIVSEQLTKSPEMD